MQDVTNTFTLPSFHCMYDIPLLLQCVYYFLLSHTIEPTGLYSSAAPLFKTFKYYLSTIRSVQVSAPQNAMFQM